MSAAADVPSGRLFFMRCVHLSRRTFLWRQMMDSTQLRWGQAVCKSEETRTRKTLGHMNSTLFKQQKMFFFSISHSIWLLVTKIPVIIIIIIITTSGTQVDAAWHRHSSACLGKTIASAWWEKKCQLSILSDCYTCIQLSVDRENKGGLSVLASVSFAFWTSNQRFSLFFLCFPEKISSDFYNQKHKKNHKPIQA